jgi:aspartate aminotransferase
MLSQRVKVISPSPTLAITAKANALRAQGVDIIGFGAGEPDFDTPDTIKRAAVDAINAGFTKYTPTAGIPELRSAVCDKLKRDNGVSYTPDRVLVSCGAKHSLFNAVMALVDPGDEVIIPAPYWVSYAEMVRCAGGVVVEIPTTAADGFRATAERIAQAVTPRTKLLILNSPSNPTGMVYNPQELERIARVVVDRDIACISDEIYEKIVYGDTRHVSIASFGPDIQARTIIINGVSKSHSMTGWRIGYAAGPRDVIAAMTNLQDHSTSNATSIAQKAALEALTGSQESVATMVAAFAERRDAIVRLVNEIPGMSCLTPTGAFYVWVDCTALMARSFGGAPIGSSLRLAELLLTEAKVAVIPGICFGNDAYVRLSYATSMRNISEGLARIRDFCAELS